MVRRVAFGKAVVAGAAGAVAWEAVARLGVWAGVPLFDIVRALGTLVSGSGAAWWQWWVAGIAMHVIVGVVWATFYAYFFWSSFDSPPFLQGMFFTLLPIILAGLIMIPQMDLMLADDLSSGFRHSFGIFAHGLGWLGPVSVILGHLIYGAVMGAIYIRPVGYAVERHKVRFG